MKKALMKVKKFFKSEKGQGMVEYGLIIGLVAVVLIAVLVAFRGQIAGIFDSLSAGIESGMAPPE